MAASQKFLHIAGYESCGFYARALGVLRSVSLLFPSRLQVIPHEFEDRSRFRSWLLGDESSSSSSAAKGFRNCFDESSAKEHATSPFCWFSKTGSTEADAADIDCYLGGHDDTLTWCRSFLSPTDNKNELKGKKGLMVPDGFSKDHNYDYDLIVIGGGSGGMAASKEASQLGARVACLDYVKPSPKGTTWGLGGTCVNVGCIPKKLFHQGSLLSEAIHADATTFGIHIKNGNDAAAAAANGQGTIRGAATAMDTDMPPSLAEPVLEHSWQVLRENVQNYIHSLNFKYRVRLREKNVTYLNKLATFKDANTIEVMDKKGKVETLTAARFLIATGGRPSPLECPGGELAVSSDDIFSVPTSPGKTLCVGASYISLECAGFLAGLGHDVTIAVRSILLRGFDQECANKLGSYMEEHCGIKFKRQVTPSKLEKIANDKIKVTFSDGSEDVYDTVLAAIGRRADTAKLGIDKLGIRINPSNGRILGKYEQTDCPNIYAVGDVLDKTPELTPVAIQAGIMLARRLFGGSNEPMDYVNVCTTVFTPIEYSCVGLSEDAAEEKYGKNNIEVYHREFVPLEWSMSMKRSHAAAFTKVIVDKTTPDENVLGIHYVGPNAGEVMQGFGAAMKQGLSFQTLVDTVGIHPTCAEEIVTLSVTKRSGEDAAAGGC